MRIAQVAPLFESVPPKLYGGTERVVAYLTHELVRQGHEVTLFASADSSTDARLVPACKRALRLEGRSIDHLPLHVLQLEHVMQRAAEFDVIHFHTDCLHFPWARRHPCRHMTTMHGRLDRLELVPLFEEFAEMPMVSISEAQRAPLLRVNWQATVHHGLPSNLLSLGKGGGGYYAFLGRISPEKRADRAIEIAKRLKKPVRIAAKVDPADRQYFETQIEPLLNDPLVEYVGEIGERDKQAFLGNAIALLFPIDWPEPFGLVMIESMACGTPVVAWRRGSVPEIVDHGITGFIADGMDEAVEAARSAAALSRARCRQRFEERFTAERMAREYVAVYERLM